MTAEQLVRTGMMAVIRDVQEWIGAASDIDGRELRAYLMGQAIVAGGLDDGES